MDSPEPPAGTGDSSSAWWQRQDLIYHNNGLQFAGAPLASWLYPEDAPTYLYNWARVEANIARLQHALRNTGKKHRIFYAMKSNRYAPLLTALAQLGTVGIDACSYPEVERALSCGFSAGQISFTATGVSRLEWAHVLSHSDIWVNADSLADLEKIGTLAPGRGLGLRLNSGLGLGYRQNPILRYADSSCLSKFGIPLEDIPEAHAICARYDLRIESLHVHSGCGYLDDQLPILGKILKRLEAQLLDMPGIKALNLGGGLGIPLVADDQPLDLKKWSAVLNSGLAGFSGEVWIEPGDYLVKDAGILVVKVTQSLKRQGKRFVTVNAGFNIHPEPAFYKLPLHPVPVHLRQGQLSPATIAGNINEAHDLWAENVLLPPLQEGDHIAFLNAGGYGASMSSNHCLRGALKERLIF